MVGQHYSPLRYPGGKVSLYDFLKRTIEKNKIVDGIYAEGFAGGAGAALNLLMLEDVREIYLNDKDELIYKFWKSVLLETDELLRLINDTTLNIEEWNYRKQILKDKNLQQELSDVELGFTAFLLNRCNRSGILRAGVIGGNHQNGDWKIDARYNKEDLMKRIQTISYYKERIHLSNKDVISFLKYLSKIGFEQNELLVYLDPPYVIQGKELYRYYFKENQHEELAKFLQFELQNKWLVSYDDHPLVHKIFSASQKSIFEFNYYANKTKIGRELVIKSDNCILPESYLHYSKRKRLEDSTFFLREAV